MKLDRNDVDVRVIDQRIGMGVGGLDTVIRLWHKPTGIIVEVPKVVRSQIAQLQIGMDAIEIALTSLDEPVDIPGPSTPIEGRDFLVKGGINIPIDRPHPDYSESPSPTPAEEREFNRALGVMKKGSPQ